MAEIPIETCGGNTSQRKVENTIPLGNAEEREVSNEVSATNNATVNKENEATKAVAKDNF